MLSWNPGTSDDSASAPCTQHTCHLWGPTPLLRSTAPLPPHQDWFPGLSPTDEKENISEARCLSEKQVSQSVCGPLLFRTIFCFVLGPIFALERFFRWRPWTEGSFKIAPRDQTDADSPSLAVLASNDKAVGSEGLCQARPDPQEIMVFLVPLPKTSSFFPFL